MTVLIEAAVQEAPGQECPSQWEGAVHSCDEAGFCPF